MYLCSVKKKQRQYYERLFLNPGSSANKELLYITKFQFFASFGKYISMYLRIFFLCRDMASTASEWVLKSTLASPVGLPFGANSNSTLTGVSGEKNCGNQKYIVRFKIQPQLFQHKEQYNKLVSVNHKINYSFTTTDLHLLCQTQGLGKGVPSCEQSDQSGWRSDCLG